MSRQEAARIVFIARAYRADDKKFRSDAKLVNEVTEALWNADFASLSALTHSVSSGWRINSLKFHYFWQDMAKSSDAVLALPGWDACPCSHAEVSLASNAGVPIFYLEDMTMLEVIAGLKAVPRQNP